MEIGQAITDERQGRVGQFFRDPKNLATMLVLGAALSGPRSNGSSPLNHTLRSGVGALAFRGGLDRGIQNQRLREQEQASVQQAREAQTENAAQRNEIAGQQVEATRDATQARRDISAADNAAAQERLDAQLRSNESIRAAQRANAREIAGLQNSGAGLSGKIMEEAYKGWAEAQANWAALGADPATQPQLETYLQNAIITSMAARGGFEFVPTPAPGDANTPVPPATEAVQQQLPAPGLARRVASDPALAEAVGLSPGEVQVADVQERIAQYQSSVRESLASGALGEEELRAILADRNNRRLLPNELLAETKRQLRLIREATITVPTREERDQQIQPTQVIPGLGPGLGRL